MIAYQYYLSFYFFSRSNKDDKNQEPLKVDTSSHDILEVDQPSASSGIGPSPKNDSESPKVKRYFWTYKQFTWKEYDEPIWKKYLLFLLLQHTQTYFWSSIKISTFWNEKLFLNLNVYHMSYTTDFSSKTSFSKYETLL